LSATPRHSGQTAGKCSTLREILPYNDFCRLLVHCALEGMLANTRGSVKFKETNFAFEKINKYFLTFFFLFKFLNFLIEK